jgi:hypothetical protein
MKVWWPVSVIFCGPAECMCQNSCSWGGQVCSWADSLKVDGIQMLLWEFLIDIYAKCRTIDLESVQQHAIMWCGLQLEDAHALGMVRKFWNILNRYEKRVYSQMISHVVVFCQLVATQASWMKACAVMLNDRSLHDFCKIGKLHLHGWLTFLAALPSTGGREYE